MKRRHPLPFLVRHLLHYHLAPLRVLQVLRVQRVLRGQRVLRLLRVLLLNFPFLFY
jgi:hypothetical protein